MTEPNENDPLLLFTKVPALHHDEGRDDEESDAEETFRQSKQHRGFAASVGHSIRFMQENIGTPLLKEYRNTKQALVETLEEADKGDDMFLNMTLTRNLSLLPTKPEINKTFDEVKQALRVLARRKEPDAEQEDLLPSYQTPEHEQQSPEDAISSTYIPLNAYIGLALAVTALSSIGPVLAKQRDVDPTMKIVWRFQGTAMLLAPLTLRSIQREGWPRLTWMQWCTFASAAACYSVLCVAFAMAINYTTVSNATILTNTQSVILIAAKLLIGNKVVFLEAFGVAVAFTGAVLAGKDAAEGEKVDESLMLNLWGDVLGLVSSIGGLGYIVLGKSLRAHMPVLVFMVLNMTTASMMILFFMWCIGQDVSWDRHVNHGVFGWMNLQGDRLPLEAATVIVCNLMGTMGYVRAFKYFSSVIIAVAALMEPVVASFTALFMGVGVLPGIGGWIGNFLVIGGTIAVMIPTVEESNKAKQQMEASKATKKDDESALTVPDKSSP